MKGTKYLFIKSYYTNCVPYLITLYLYNSLIGWDCVYILCLLTTATKYNDSYLYFTGGGNSMYVIYAVKLYI